MHGGGDFKFVIFCALFSYFYFYHMVTTINRLSILSLWVCAITKCFCTGLYKLCMKYRQNPHLLAHRIRMLKWSIMIRPSSVYRFIVYLNFSHFRHLVRKYWANSRQTWASCFLTGYVHVLTARACWNRLKKVEFSIVLNSMSRLLGKGFHYSPTTSLRQRFDWILLNCDHQMWNGVLSHNDMSICDIIMH